MSQKIFYPSEPLQWGKKVNSQTPLDSRSGFLMEIWDETPITPVLLKRIWKDRGGVQGDNNHPTANELTVADNSILTVKMWHLSTNNCKMQAIIINSDTGILPNTDSNIPNTYPKGMVNGNGSVGGSNIPLYKALKGGQSVIFRFQAAPQATSNWYKINNNLLFGSAAGLSMENPNDGVDYNTETAFQIDYYGGFISWANPALVSGDQAYFDNTKLWATENSFALNPFYKENISYTGCQKIVNGLKLSTWNGAGGGTTLVNQPFETWDFGWNGYRVLKVLKYAEDGKTPAWFELRGKDAFLQFTPLASNIDGTEVDCSNILGAKIGLAIDESVTEATGYTKDGNIFKISQNLCVTPTIVISIPNDSFALNESFTIHSQATNATSYQWYKDNQILIGATESVYEKNNCQITDVGQYYCKAKNACGGGLTTSQKDSNVIVMKLASTIELEFPVTLQGVCNGDVERGYSTSNDINTVTVWYPTLEIPLTQDGSYYFFARLITNHNVFSVSSLINTANLLTK